MEQTASSERSERERLQGRIMALEEQLEHQAQSYDALLDASSDLILLMDTDGRVIHVNRPMARRLNASPSPLKGTTVFEHLPADLAANRWAQAREVISSGRPVHFVDSNGDRLFANRFHPVFDQAGEVTALAVFATDITEHWQRDEQLRFLVEHSSDALVMIDSDGCQRYVSPGAERITGFPAAELEGRSIDTLIHPEDLDGVLVAWNEVLQHPDRIVTVQYRHIHKIREWVYSEAIAKNCLAAPAANAVIATVRDITQQKRAEEVLRQHQQTVHALLNVTTESIHLIDRQGTVLLANEATARRLGTTVEALVGRRIHDFFPAEVASRRQEQIEKVFSSGQPATLVDERQGLVFTSNLWPLADNEGRVDRLAIFAKDITEQVQAERAFHQSKNLLNATQRLAKVGGWEWHPTNHSMTWTEETYRIHGLAPEDRPTVSAELINRSLDCYRDQDRPMILAAFRRCVDEGIPYDMQFPFRSTDGRNLWIRTMAEPVFEEGRIDLVRGNIVDITGEKRLEHLLAARLRLSEMSATLSLDDLLASVLEEAEQLTGSTIGFFHFVGADQHTLTLQAWSPSTTAHFCKAAGKGLHYPAAEAGVWVDCLRERRPVIHNDYASLPHRKGLPAGHTRVVRELVVPVFRAENIVAIFGVGNKDYEYDQEDIDMVTALGDMVWDMILRKQAENELRLSEERFRLSFERSPAGIAMLSTTFRFLRANEAFCRMVGYSETELSDLTFTDITHPEERQGALLRIQRLLTGEIDRYDVEKRYLHKSGQIIWGRVSVALVRDGNRTPLHFLSIIQDITAWKKAERALRESESRYQRIVETAREGISTMDDQQRITSVNEHMAVMLGLSPADMLDRPVEDFMFAEDLAAHEERMAVRRQGQGGHYEHRFRHRDGHAIWTIVSATPLQDEEGRFAGSFAMFTNITARKEAEKQLKERNAYLQSVFRSSPVGIGVVVDRMLQDANTRLCEMTGYHRKNLIGQSARMLYPSEEDYRWVGEEKYAQISRHGTGTVETRWQRQDGRIIDVLLSSTPIDVADLSLGVTFSALDITDRKQNERQIRKQADFTRRVLDSTAAHIAILDSDGIIIDVNTPWYRFAEENNITAMEKIGPGTSYFCTWSAEHGDTTNAAPALEGIRQVQRGEREDFQIEYPCHSCSENRWFTMRVLPLDGAPGQVLVSHTDITPLKESEERLVAALAEKDVLLREVHHRVKNNLAAIISLLDMQRRLLEDAQGRDILTELGSRIRSMSLIHEKLYRADNLARIDFQDYLQSLVSHLRTSFGSPLIHCRTEAEGIKLPLDLAVPCGMIVNELVTNAIKHAFPKGQPAPGRDACHIRVGMRQSEGICTLWVADNGVGLRPGYDWTAAKTLGMVLVRMLGRHQLGGSYVLDQREGCSLTLTFNEQRGKK